MIGKYLFAFCLSFGFLSIAANAQEGKKLSSLTAAELKSVTISFERTSCYGNCPAYKITIKGDGSVAYEGIRDVKTVGKKTSSISEIDLRSILKAFDDAEFLTIGDNVGQKCTCGECTDFPSATITLAGPGIAHAVNHYHGCRCAKKSLFEAEETIDKIVNSQQWTGDVSKAGPFGTTCFGPN